MLYDRPYMRANSFGGTPRVLFWLLIINLAIFVLQNLMQMGGGRDFLATAFGLSLNGLKEGKVHAFLTYSFLHAGIIHIGLNLLVLFFMGRLIESLLGPKQFLLLYFGAVLVGGLTWFVFHAFSGTPSLLMGASAGVIGILIFFCLLRPEEPVDFLLFFIIPVTLKPKWITWFLTGYTLFGLFFLELPAAGGGQITAHSAHLGGIIGAFIYFHYVYLGKAMREGEPRMPAGVWRDQEPSRAPNPPRALRMKNKTQIDRDQLRFEVDRVLDKINEQGFGSLTDEEKKLLDRAREILNK
jgi:membrane associated rhomboid family serine protease